MTEQTQTNERDPVLDLNVSLNMKVEDVNVLLHTLSKLPYSDVASIIGSIRNDVIAQVQQQQKESAKDETDTDTQKSDVS